MAMTKSDYEIIAASIKKTYERAADPAAQQSVLDTTAALSLDLKDQNPRMKRSVFLIACGYDEFSRAVDEALLEERK